MTPAQARDWHNRKAGLLDIKPEPVFAVERPRRCPVPPAAFRVRIYTPRASDRPVAGARLAARRRARGRQPRQLRRAVPAARAAGRLHRRLGRLPPGARAQVSRRRARQLRRAAMGRAARGGDRRRSARASRSAATAPAPISPPYARSSRAMRARPRSLPAARVSAHRARRGLRVASRVRGRLSAHAQDDPVVPRPLSRERRGPRRLSLCAAHLRGPLAVAAGAGHRRRIRSAARRRHRVRANVSKMPATRSSSPTTPAWSIRSFRWAARSTPAGARWTQATAGAAARVREGDP